MRTPLAATAACLLLLVLGGLLSGCGTATSRSSVSKTVDPELVGQIPAEGRRWTYEAENEVIIALDRLDTARELLGQAKREVTAGEVGLSAAQKRGKGEEPARARVAWLEKREDRADVGVDAAELAVFCSRVNLELTKAKAAIRFGLPVAEDFVKPFEEEYESCAKDQAELKQKADTEAAGVVKAKDAWRKARSDFSGKTGDYNHGLWID